MSALALISWDRATKDLAKEHLKHKPPVTFFHNTFRLEYVENTGAAMSMGDKLPKAASFWLLSMAPLGLLAGAFGYTISRAKELSFWQMLPIALIFAGGVGNIIDRLMYNRHVTDFMNINIPFLKRGIFNFADVCITAGALCLLVYLKKKPVQVPAS
jgi:signal peptidase II